MGAPAGWYAAPNAPGMIQYWDGTAWTAHMQPQPPAPAASPAHAAAPMGASYSPYAPPAAPAGALGGMPGEMWGQARERAEAFESTGRTVSTYARSIMGMVFGLVFFAVTLFIVKPHFFDAAQVAEGEATIQGTVIEQNSTDTDDGRMCSPEVTFQVDGQTYTTRMNGSSSECPAVGSQLKVIYDEADPADARLAPNVTMQVFGWVFVAIGAGLFLTSTWSLISAASAGATRHPLSNSPTTL